MILIIGGFCQGKTEYLRHLPEYQNMESTGTPPLCADGAVDPIEHAWKCPVILGFHHFVRQLADEDKIRDFIDRILAEYPDALITMDEVGYGIVPIDPADRAYRELVGYAGQRLAKEADQVHRVVCGIGTRIK